MPAEIKGSGAGHHRGSHAALGRDTDRHRKRDDQHRQIRTPLEPQLDTIDEFIALRSLKITLGSDEIPVGKCALFFRGRYLEIGDEEVTVEPLSEYVSGRYVGAPIRRSRRTRPPTRAARATLMTQCRKLLEDAPRHL